MRRNQKQLEGLVLRSSGKTKALAYYNLGVFHDNNSREVEAIPNYKTALRLGLEPKTKAKALAWLASSLYKTRKPKEAIKSCREALRMTSDPVLKKFLKGLEARILKSKV
jgi:tetratricopeptide (TPR) repeat protein